MDACTTGTDNTAVGARALGALTTSNQNTAVGYKAGTAITTGGQNTIVGENAAIVATTGDRNTVVGRDAGGLLTTGTNNLLLGHDAGKSGSPHTVTVDSDQIVLGDNSITNAFIKVSFTVTSDERDKTDIADFTKGLDIVNSLRPVTYKWDMRSNYSDDLSVSPDGSKKSNVTEIGLIAQEIETVEKANGYGSSENNRLFFTKSTDGKNYGLKYERLVPVLINAIKELSTRVTALEAG